MIDPSPSPDELTLFDEVSNLGASLWESSLSIVAKNTDPKIFSVMLYKRLWSHHRGFAVLWNNSLMLEADIVLRSSLEAAICIAANFRLREEFVTLMRQDAAFTVTSQIKLHRAKGETGLVRDREETLRDLRATLPEGAPPAKLGWHSLAAAGQVPDLYDFHKMLSGISSHVTGLSIISGVVDGAQNTTELQAEPSGLNRRMRLIMMAGATLNGSMLHAGMLDDNARVRSAFDLITRLGELSNDLSG